MKIIIKDETQQAIISNDELDNPNFVDVEFLDEEVIDVDNPRGFVAEMTIPLEELKRAVDAFWEIKIEKLTIKCTCGEPWTLGVVHRKDQPCYWPPRNNGDTAA
mgnify:CR=1 FL=1